MGFQPMTTGADDGAAIAALLGHPITDRSTDTEIGSKSVLSAIGERSTPVVVCAYLLVNARSPGCLMSG